MFVCLRALLTLWHKLSRVNFGLHILSCLCIFCLFLLPWYSGTQFLTWVYDVTLPVLLCHALYVFCLSVCLSSLQCGANYLASLPHYMSYPASTSSAYFFLHVILAHNLSHELRRHPACPIMSCHVCFPSVCLSACVPHNVAQTIMTFVLHILSIHPPLSISFPVVYWHTLSHMSVCRHLACPIMSFQFCFLCLSICVPEVQFFFWLILIFLPCHQKLSGTNYLAWPVDFTSFNLSYIRFPYYLFRMLCFSINFLTLSCNNTVSLDF